MTKDANFKEFTLQKCSLCAFDQSLILIRK